MSGVVYDPECVDFAVALRSVVVLFRNGRWSELNSLGIQRGDMYAGRLEAGDGFIPVTDTAEHLLEMTIDSVSNLRTLRGLREFMQLCPFALHAAAQLLHRYLSVTQQSRREYYRKEAA